MFTFLAGAPQAKMRGCRSEQTSIGPRDAINAYCRTKHWLCVADLTSKNPCRLRQHNQRLDSDFLGGTAYPDPTADLARLCPDHVWTEIEGVHFFAPRNSKDSQLNISIGRVKAKEVNPVIFLQKLLDLTRLPQMSGNVECASQSIGMSLEDLKKLAAEQALHPVPFVDTSPHANFDIPAGKIRDGVIRASKQFGPSFWTIMCYGEEGCFSWVDDYADLKHQ